MRVRDVFKIRWFGLFLAVLAIGGCVTMLYPSTGYAELPPFLQINKKGEYECVLQVKTQVDVEKARARVKYTRVMNTERIHAMMAENGSKVPSNVVIMGLYTSPDKQISAEMAVGMQTDNRTGLTCLYYEAVNVTIKIDPHIYLNRDYKHARCRKEIKKHEEQHSIVHKQVIDKYADLIEKHMMGMTAGVGAVGPVKAEEIDAKSLQMQALANAAVQAVFAPMNQEYNALQAQVDSVAEYARINAICDKYER